MSDNDRLAVELMGYSADRMAGSSPAHNDGAAIWLYPDRVSFIRKCDWRPDIDLNQTRLCEEAMKERGLGYEYAHARQAALERSISRLNAEIEEIIYATALDCCTAMLAVLDTLKDATNGHDTN